MYFSPSVYLSGLDETDFNKNLDWFINVSFIFLARQCFAFVSGCFIEVEQIWLLLRWWRQIFMLKLYYLLFFGYDMRFCCLMNLGQIDWPDDRLDIKHGWINGWVNTQPGRCAYQKKSCFCKKEEPLKN